VFLRSKAVNFAYPRGILLIVKISIAQQQTKMSRCDMFGGLPMDIQMAMKRYMGEGQGDTSGAEETSSSDSSDDEAGQMTSPVDKIIARRKKIQFQITLQQKCLDFIVKNHVSLAKDQKKQFKLMGMCMKLNI